ncbi:MAG TPA: hypothetical protein VFU47_13660 [Armatimonadota bacterium]|nr:hypothetical protein [Armatimonadota bacterium]
MTSIPQMERPVPQEGRLPHLQLTGDRLRSHAVTQLQRCCGSQGGRGQWKGRNRERRASVPCGCVFHPVEQDGAVAPCGHDIQEWGAIPLREMDLYWIRVEDVRRWALTLIGYFRVAADEHVRQWAYRETLPQDFAVTTRAGAAYYGLWHAVEPEGLLAWIREAAQAELDRRGDFEPEPSTGLEFFEGEAA